MSLIFIIVATYLHAAPIAGVPDRALQQSILENVSSDPDFHFGDQVTVRVKKGEATIIGTVSSWDAHHKATQDAFIGGASRVVNKLRVRSDKKGSSKAFVYNHPIEPILASERPPIRAPHSEETPDVSRVPATQRTSEPPSHSSSPSPSPSASPSPSPSQTQSLASPTPVFSPPTPQEVPSAPPSP